MSQTPFHGHEHHGCLHNTLSYCRICDLVWCKGCRREWPAYAWTYTNVPYKWYPTTTTWATTPGNTSGTTLTNAAVPHTHT